MEKNYYDVLGVPFNATEHEITRAWRKLVKDHHPDRGGDAQKFREVTEAYETLQNEISRRLYDSILRSAEAPEPQPAGNAHSGPQYEEAYSHYGTHHHDTNYQAPPPPQYEDAYFTDAHGYGNTHTSGPAPQYRTGSILHINPYRLRDPLKWPKHLSISALILVVGGILWFGIEYYFTELTGFNGMVRANLHKLLIGFATIYAIHTACLLGGYGIKFNRFWMYAWMLFCSSHTLFPYSPGIAISTFILTPFILVTAGVEIARFANSRTF